VKLKAIAAAIAAAGISGVKLREAAASELGQVIDLVNAAVRTTRDNSPDLCGFYWMIDAVFPDRVIVCSRGRYYSYPYTIGDDNVVALGAATEVVVDYAPVGARVAEAAANGSGVFIEALAAADASKPTRYLVRVINAGTSLNGVTYPAAVLREAAPIFEGVRVFVRNDDEHSRGDPKAKDFHKLVGKLTEPRFIEAAGKQPAHIQAVLDVLETSDVAAKLREAVARGMTDLFGLSIDADGKAKRVGKLREATSLTKVSSVDLIIEPGAGGQVIRFTESLLESDMKLRQQMLDHIRASKAKAFGAKRADALAAATDEEVMTAYREAVAAESEHSDDDAGGTGAGGPAPVTQADLDARFRMVEARANARVAIAQSKLPEIIQQRLATRFSEAASFTDADVTKAIEEERAFVVKLRESVGGSGAQIRGLGDTRVEAGKDFADKVQERLDAFFDRAKAPTSFREAYIDITGDRGVTGMLANCDRQRLREAVVDVELREAIDSTTFASDILGNTITRAMIREYGSLEAYNPSDFEFLVDEVPLSDFRTQERTRMGGYGNLPTVAEAGPYTALSSPTGEKATYALSKRGGTETLTLEMIANDDVGVIRRIPLSLATAAGRTLYEFVFDFMRTNAAIYDAVALAHASHNNLGIVALDATGFAAARLRLKKQVEKSSAKRLGITARHVLVPSDLEEAAYNLFVRTTNLDKSFVQSRNPTVHVIDYWTDTNNWWATADKSQVPLIELGFYNGRREPELFVQDQPTNASLFTNDQVTYKIRHIYNGAVVDFRGFDGSVVP
jgi:hypothetical protein